MPFSRPTLTAIIDRVRDDIDARLPGADSRVRRNVLDVLATVFGGVAHGLYGLMDYVWRQILVDQAEGDVLEERHSYWGVLRKGETPARGSLTLTGVNGLVVPAGAELVRSDGAEYLTLAAVTIAGGVATVSVEARDGGAGGNAEAGQRLVFSSPVAGVNAQALVDVGGLGGGAAEEDDEALRGRIVTRIQQPPHGGNAADYVAWALEVPGVTRAWPSAGEMGPGTVTVRFVMDARVDIIPLVADIDAVFAHIDAVRPVTAALFVTAPVAKPLDMTIRAVPPTVAVQAAIVEELADLLRREAAPGGTILISHIREAISLAAGEMDHELISPNVNVAHATGHIAVPGAITWL